MLEGSCSIRKNDNININIAKYLQRLYIGQYIAEGWKGKVPEQEH